MLFEKCMVDELFDRGSIIWIFLKAAIQEISNLCTYEQISWNFDLVFYNFY